MYVLAGPALGKSYRITNQKKVPGPPDPWNKYRAGNYCDPNWVYAVCAPRGPGRRPIHLSVYILIYLYTSTYLLHTYTVYTLIPACLHTYRGGPDRTRLPEPGGSEPCQVGKTSVGEWSGRAACVTLLI